MTEPNGVFHVIGHTREDIIGGGMFRLLTLADVPFRRMGELHNQVRPLDAEYRAGKVAREDVEVFFYVPLDFGGGQQFGRDYQVVEFFNDDAYRLCGECHIGVPPVIRQITREQLPSRSMWKMKNQMKYRNKPNGQRCPADVRHDTEKTKATEYRRAEGLSGQSKTRPRDHKTSPPKRLRLSQGCQTHAV